jgi:hypothetical protein
LKDLLVKEENITSMIFLLRGERVMLDSDLAQLYGVTTARLNQQVNRNKQRFPDDFMFELSKDEFNNLMLQNATSSWGGRRKLPKVFTEHGAIMLASVLNSRIAIDTSILVVRAFVKLREFVMMSQEITKKLEDYEKATNNKLNEHDKMFQVVFDTLKKVLLQESKPKKPIGFLSD